MKLFYEIGNINWLRIMKLSCMQLLSVIMFAGVSYARSSSAQINMDQRVSLIASHTSIADVLDRLEELTSVKFVYSRNVVDVSRKVAFHARNETLRNILNEVLHSHGINYEVINDRLVLSPAPAPIAESRPKIDPHIVKSWFSALTAPLLHGKVTDSKGNPLIGVTVKVKGTSIGTITDAGGNFSLEVSDNAKLVVSYVGFDTKEVPVSESKTITIILEVSATGLNEITVTALGIKRESRSLGYAVQKVEGNNLQSVKGVDIGTSLTGRVAGLVIRNSTEFNAKPTIRLRGENPMLVIDGVPYSNISLRDIPTDDIESISVLKGPTAAALYGSRGSNGAIMITTKKGKGEGLSIDINSNTMVQLGFLAIPKVQTSYGHGIDGHISTDYVWGPKLDIGNKAMQWNPISKKMEEMPLISSGKDNLKNFLQTGVITNNNISVTQSGERGYFRAGINHIYEKGQFPNSKLNIINYTMSGELKVGDKFTVESHMGYTRQASPQIWGRGYGAQGYLYQILMWTGPDYDIRQYRDYWVVPNQKQNWLYTAWYDNPYLIAYEKLDGIEQNKLHADILATYNFNKDFNLVFRSGYDFYKNEETVRNPAGINSTRGGSAGNTFSWNYSGKGMYGMGQMWGFSTNSDVILTYNKDINKFNFNVLGGGSVSYYQDREQGARTRNGLAIPGWYSLANAVPSTTAGVDAIINNFGTWSKQVNSLYGKASISWDEAVYLDLTGRNDWSSTQPSAQRSYFYPSVSTSIILSHFIPMPHYIDMWKIRGSWTEDKSPAGVYDNNRTFSSGTSWGLPSSSYPSQLLGTDLFPSATKTWEIGTAAYAFNQRLHLDIAYFRKYYYDQQTSATISSASGFSSTLINTKETYARKGMEITLDGSIIKRDNLEWHSMINYSFEHRYYVNLDPVYSADNLWTKKGARLDAYISPPILRDPKGQIINNNGMPVLSDYDTNLGYTDPDFAFGFINDFTIKNFVISINIDCRIGGIMYDYIWNKMFDTGANPETDTKWRYDEVVKGLKNYVGPGVKVIGGDVTYDKYGRITSDTRKYGPNDVQVSYQDYEQWLNGAGYEHGLKNQSFIKLREISIGYNIPNALLGRTGIKNASVSLTAQNLLMWTNFPFSDPDLGDENLNAPSMRMVGINIKLGL